MSSGGPAQSRSGSSQANKIAGPRSRAGRTAIVATKEIDECLARFHDVRPGRNAHSAYLVCRSCRHHAVWLKDSVAPDFFEFDRIRGKVQKLWVALHGSVKG